ncbi:MAG: glycosyltransferase family 4 protein [Acidimicrobiales bacterium]
MPRPRNPAGPPELDLIAGVRRPAPPAHAAGAELRGWMRTLVIAGDEPWPEDSGSRMRLGTVLRGLRRAGRVELVSVVSVFREVPEMTEGVVDLAGFARVAFDSRPATGIGLLPTLVRPTMPLALPRRDRSMVTEELGRHLSGSYDLIWYFGAREWVLTGAPDLAPGVVDLDDLEDRKIEARLSLDAPEPPSNAARLRQRVGDAVSREEARRWRRLYRRISARADAVVVCSDVDAARAAAAGLGRVEVVPNGYRLSKPPVGKSGDGFQAVADGSHPVVLFAGLLRYPPNIDACKLLATWIGPLLRELVPEVRIRLVGDHHPELIALHDPPRVTVVGRVPDMTTELARADAVVVPVRYGSGTRVKIVEAFAHRVPVVATPLGAEGLEATDGEHLLLGRTAEELAAACGRVIGDRALRRRLIDSASELYHRRYRSEVIEDRVAELAGKVAGRDSR